jgi:cysteine desulfurase
VATALGCEPLEVVFTSGGTEANNLALASLAAGARSRAFAACRIEHPSVLRPLEHLEGQGWQARWIQAGESGSVAVEHAASVLDSDLGFACLQAANQETGALQPLAEFSGLCAARSIPWHCDAVQAWGRIALSAREAGAATLALSGHKLGAPKGIGALYIRRGTLLEPVLRGGPQARERRAGTENVGGAAALAAALDAAVRDLEPDARWVAGLRDRLVAGARNLWSGIWLNGPEEEHRRLPNTASLSFPGIEAELLVQALDLEGVAVSAGAACTSGAIAVSEVLSAMGLPEWRTKGAIRVSLGPRTTSEAVDHFLGVLAQVLPRLRG